MTADTRPPAPTFPPLALALDSFGRLSLTDAQGRTHAPVQVVRAFPIAAPQEGISLLDADGHELAWVARLADLPGPECALLEQALQQREFMPEIRRVISVSTFVTPSVWQVQTDRGETALTLKGEEDIRRLAADLLIVNDAHGVQYLIRKLSGMDKQSRKLLDRFL